MKRRYTVLLLICGALVSGAGFFVYRVVSGIPDQKFCGSAARSVAGFLVAHEGHFPSSWTEFIAWDNARGSSWSEDYLKKIGELPWRRSIYDLQSTDEIAAKTTTTEEHMRRYFNSVFASTYTMEKRPNQSSEPTPTAGTSAAEQPLVPAAVVAHL